MIYIVAKVEFRFNKEQDQSEWKACEAVQVCRTKEEAEQAAEIFNAVCEGEYTYDVITNHQIGEWLR